MISGRTKAITVIDDIFDATDCEQLVRYFEDRKYQARLRTGEISVAFLPIVNHSDNLPVDDFSASKVKKVFGQLAPEVRIQRAHVELRSEGAGMPFHIDQADRSTVFTSVTYLNDSFSGGHTVVRPQGETTDKFDTVIVPRKGRTVFFDGLHFEHRVTTTDGDRYTMPIWYRLLPGDFPEKHKWWQDNG